MFRVDFENEGRVVASFGFLSGLIFLVLVAAPLTLVDLVCHAVFGTERRTSFGPERGE